MSQKPVSAESMLFNVGAETGVLGGLMLDNDRWDEIAPLLNSGDFYYGQHQTVFREIERLVSAGLPIDLITLSESMERKNLLARCGGFAYLAELSKNTPSAANIVAYAEIVREQALLTADSSFEGDHDAVGEASDIPLLPANVSLSSVAFANVGLEPVNDIWAISALQDDIDHLQDMAYRLVFELAEAMGCEMHVSEDKSTGAAGFAVSEHGGEFALFLAGVSGHLPHQQFNMFMFCMNFFGSQSAGDAPVFDDIHVVKTLCLTDPDAGDSGTARPRDRELRGKTVL